MLPKPIRLRALLLPAHLLTPNSSHIAPKATLRCLSSKPSPYATPLHLLLHPLSNPHLLSYAPIFQFFTAYPFFKLGQQAHAHMLLRGFLPNSFVASKMVAMYASSGDLASAMTIFGFVDNPSFLLCNSIIRGCATNGYPLETISLYCQMHCLGITGDYFTFPFVLKSCADVSNVWLGKCVHGLCLRIGWGFDMYVATSLIDMYVKCGELIDGRKLFDEIPVRDVSTWNAMITGFMKNGDVCVAEELFTCMPCRNIVSWTVMISGYTQNGFADKALCLFDEMLKEDSEIKPNWVTIISVLPACGHSAALKRGRQIHDYANRIGLKSNAPLQIALISMYAKCGSLDDARRCFSGMRQIDKTLLAWNAMITACASHGCGMETVETFENMISAGVKPDAISFVGLLSGCSHSGLTDIGLKYFDRMRIVFSIEPRVEHYACVIDLLGRAGRLQEAREIVDQMPMEPGASIWGALLAASHKYKNLELAEIAATRLFVLEPELIGNYVLLSNIYADLGMWDKVDEIRALAKSRGVKKNPACSWIEVNGKVHLLLGGDTSHPQWEEIYLLLETLREKIRAAGYITDTSFVFHDISEEEKEHNLTTHSEKLAVAFGLLNTSPGVVLRVTKNLRICGDCHTFMKFVSNLYKREIIMRDLNRFHHFKDGCCSCGEYW